MAKKKTVLLTATAVLLVLCAVLLVFFAKDDNNGSAESGSSAESFSSYTVAIKTEGGMPLSEIGVYVYKADDHEDIVSVGETDREGKMSFNADGSGSYIAVLRDVPDGYKTEEFYAVDKDYTEIVPETVLSDINGANDTVFELGSVICDFSVTAYDGTEYKISELLKEKKAIVLNFWFLNCGPCRTEFPYMQEAYEKHRESIEVLALNPVDGTNDSISEFAQDLGLTFPMAVCDADWQTYMRLNAYPTTVVVDRYGMIAMIHKGSITETETFDRIFEYFTSDDYVQTVVRNISDIE